ncbi:glycosyltransferase family 4 protein [Thiopseudomonas acetoxidans]|uniref:Glycosyltransferase family 4 protein n=1 Tax=Thiopseudomonas acetoxidans TaxID=3041622 RepID=A0ABT7SSF0_9GAMM|nr:glycosyltransferase family 4 protein [Thiopseudomonas sp. CY1220]MDM7858497.1 glycosyltransferase family 4 protein [Thiopseudomonas sp. CY1220]
MRIAYLSSSIIPSRAANSVHVMKMCNAFSANRHEVTLYAPNRKQEQEEGVSDVYEFYGVDSTFHIKKMPYPQVRFVRSFIYAFACLCSLFFSKQNLIYGRDFLSCFLSSFFFATIYEAHSPLSGIKLNLLKFMLRRKKFKRLVVISEALKNIFIKDGAIAKYQEKIFVAHDGADEVVNAENKKGLQGRFDVLQIGYVGHLYKGRGIDVILDSAEKISDANFHIVGGVESDISYWKRELNSRNIENVYFYGFVSPAEASSICSLIDIFLAPYASVVSVYGGKGDTSKFMSPLKIFEYMSHGKAIICSDLPVLREVLNERNAILVNSVDVNEWVDAINKLADEELRNQLGQQALYDFLTAYTWKMRAQNLINF